MAHLNAALEAAWIPLTQRGVYWGAMYLIAGGIAAGMGATIPGAITMIAGVVLACTALAPLGRNV